MTYEQRYDLIVDKIRELIDLSQESGTNPILDLASFCIEMQAGAFVEGYNQGSGDADYDVFCPDTHVKNQGYIPEPPPTPKPDNWNL